MLMFVSVKLRNIHRMARKQREILNLKVGISVSTSVVSYICLFCISFLFTIWFLDILLFYREKLYTDWDVSSFIALSITGMLLLSYINNHNSINFDIYMN